MIEHFKKISTNKLAHDTLFLALFMGMLVYALGLVQKLPLAVLHDEYLYAVMSMDIGIGSRSDLPSVLYFSLNRAFIALVDDPLIAGRLLNMSSWAVLFLAVFSVTKNFGFLTRLKTMVLVITPFQLLTLTYLMPDFFFYATYMLAVLSLSKGKQFLCAIFLIAAALAKVHGLLSYFLFLALILFHNLNARVSLKDILLRKWYLITPYVLYIAASTIVYGEVKPFYSGAFYSNTLGDFFSKGYYKSGAFHGTLAFLSTSLFYGFIVLIYSGFARLRGLFDINLKEQAAVSAQFALLNLLGYVLLQSVFTGISDAQAGRAETFMYLRYSLFSLSGLLLALCFVEENEKAGAPPERIFFEIVMLFATGGLLFWLSSKWVFAPNDNLLIFNARDLVRIVILSTLAFVICNIFRFGKVGRLVFVLAWIPVLFLNLNSYRLNWGDLRPKDAEAIGTTSASECSFLMFDNIEYSEKYRMKYGYDVGRRLGASVKEPQAACSIRETSETSEVINPSLVHGKYEIVIQH